ncbi:MAG: heme exporter protein CcmD [Burkholderiales bacterium]
MNWSSWSDFWAMGGYGLYVWGSYGITFALMALELASVRRRRRMALQNVVRLRGTNDGGMR